MEERKDEFGGIILEKGSGVAWWLLTGGFVSYATWEGFVLDLLWYGFWFAAIGLCVWCYRGYRRGEFDLRRGWI